ncbi:sulfatase, partial [Candidatus Aminicenantes bacterium AC-334-E05]|nr:sulfatase [Candidatus Aminicenantes bacterium AC-334-E05]
MRKNRNFFLLILIFIFILPFLNCKRKLNIKDLIGNKSYNYILISVDTLRADRLECYGFSRIKTPTINEMARSGIKFERCISQTPLTLPSHTTILTGTYPFFHGVRDNGGFIVPKELQTIAELFKEKKYITGAIVGAYVLDSKWGLNQGFDFYYDRFNLDRKEGFSIADVQRRGDEVITVAINWLNKVKNNNFFLFLHLYDPHTPYEPPSPFKEKYSNDLYLGEIAYTDFQLGRLWEYLKEEKLLDKTILIFTSDHGESLGEHGEATHGFFVYQEGIHVPLIFVLPFKKLQNLIREQVVSLVDIMPTILELAKIPIPKQIQGRSLVSYFLNKNKNEDSYAYSETYYPRFHYGWSEVK